MNIFKKNEIPFPGKIVHHIGPCSKTGHGSSFNDFTITKGNDASSYFKWSGIYELANNNGGICTFWMNDNLALYQSTNTPLVDECNLEPSINTNAELFGDFIGTLLCNDAERNRKRSVIERVFGNERFIKNLQDDIKKHFHLYVERNLDKQIPLDEFALNLISYTNSHLCGVLDLKTKPLSDYISSEKYGYIAKDFFEIASEVISKVNHSSIHDADLIVDMTREILKDNFYSINLAPRTNIIKSHFSVLGYDFTIENIMKLTTSELKGLGTIIIASYDTTSLSFTWLLLYLNNNFGCIQKIKKSIEKNEDVLELSLLYVLEAIRLGGSNPTALWRRVKNSFSLKFGRYEIIIPKGTMIWLDRRQANRDSDIYPEPNKFNILNIKKVLTNDNPLSILDRRRSEINSFNMINTKEMIRKCPGRLFSVIEQAILLSELYKSYDVILDGGNLNLAKKYSMPRPKNSGSIIIRNK
ncbi:cytochrome P450 [Xenorhabdus griffiniae]|uniref:cytochrome P450 n=1 Tax=Xenorhabdus griffiniae TaxID=351672 RepID=UPI00235813C0|nr:cytochrome P450 [Xenorhabdus griffiniae]MDC9607176.1 cytochrome P450 [Xenorhabdus griffiniae]